MKKVISFWTNTSLILRIAGGIVVGVVLALLVPQAAFLKIFGDIFVSALKAIAPVLVAVLVMSSLAKSGKSIGSQFRTVIALYMLTTFSAAIFAVIASKLFPVKLALSVAAENSAPAGLFEVFKTLFMNMVANPIDSVAQGSYTGILFWAIVIGLALKKVASENTINAVSDFSDAISKTVQWVIQFAPFGIMGIVYSSVSDGGLNIFTSYGKLLAVLVGTMLFCSLIVNPILVGVLLRRNPYPLVFRCLRESGIQAFFTRSSAANIPINMSLCEKLGLNKDFYSVSIPLGSTINMDGAAVTITVMTLAAANTVGVQVPISTAIFLGIISTLAACGASGVAGGSLLLIPMACSFLGINSDIAMQVVAVGFIIGVVQDSVETALNSSGDVIFTATAEYYTRMKEERKQKKALKK